MCSFMGLFTNIMPKFSLCRNKIDITSPKWFWFFQLTKSGKSGGILKFQVRYTPADFMQQTLYVPDISKVLHSN